VPSCLDQSCRIHAIPVKKTDQVLVSYLTSEELQALLDAPDTVGLPLDQIDRQSMSSVHIMGKGRRERVLPLWKETAAAIKAWLKVRLTSGAPELFLNARGEARMVKIRERLEHARSFFDPPQAV
jgi:site-specific recombinase XerC